MPEFTIFSIGDAAFLEQIIIAVSMITGVADFRKMVSVGLLIGILLITVQSAFQGGKQINWQQIFIGWLMYAAFFTPKCLIKIEDSYTGEVRVVANAPIVLGGAGGIISNVGYSITELFETGYGAISSTVTDSHFAESLKLLNDARRRTYDGAVFTALNDAIGGSNVDVRKSLENYIKECTLTKIDLGLMTLDKFMEADINTAIPFHSGLYGTRVYLGQGGAAGKDLTCHEAWFGAGALSDSLKQLNSQQVTTVMNRLLSVNSSYTGINSPAKLQSALAALGDSRTSSLDYMKTALIEPLYYEAAAGRYQDLQDYSSALMINQALQQRNTQWAAEQSMFMTSVRPMLTFFEGFVYAITPIMAFILVIGAMGVTLAGKYAQTLIWIQLWMPVLSISNLFIHTAATNELSSLTSNGLHSMYALSSAGDTLQTWIGIGGLMASATPIISLFIVTGSNYAFTSLAGKLSGGDMINEKMLTPDTISPGAMVSAMPEYGFNQFSGMIKTGAESSLGTMTLGSTFTTAVNSAHATQEQTSRTFGQALAKGITNASTDQEMYSRLASFGSSISSMSSSQTSLLDEKAQSLREAVGLDSSHQDAVKGILALQGTAGMGVPQVAKLVTGLDARVTGQGQTATESAASTTEKMSKATEALNRHALSEQDSQALKKQIAQGVQNQTTNSYTKNWSDSESSNLTEAAQDFYSASETFSTMSSLQHAAQGSSTQTLHELGAQISRNGGAANYLNEAVRLSPTSVRKMAEKLEQTYSSDVYGLSPDIAKATAQLKALTSGSAGVNGYQNAINAINMASGLDYAGVSDPNANSGLDGSNVGHVNIGSLRGANGQLPFDPTAAPDVGQDHNRNLAALNGQAAETRLANIASARAEFTNNVGMADISRSAMLVGGFDGMLDWLGRRGGEFASSAIDAFKDSAASGSLDAGNATIAKLQSEHGDQFRTTMHDYAVDRFGLTDAQANVFAASFDMNSSQWYTAVDTLNQENATGINADGSRYVTEQDRDFTQRMAKNIHTATLLGDRADSHLSHVKQYNLKTGTLF